MPRMRLNPSLGYRLLCLYGLLAMANLLSWFWACTLLRHFPLLLGSALLAYVLGLRHALDADHIAAIDNVTRTLMQRKKPSVAVGLYFSLGHSSVVIALTMALAASAPTLQHHFGLLAHIGGIVGTLISASFLFAIAGANLLVLGALFKSLRHVASGGRFQEADIERLWAKRGLITRLCHRLFHLIETSWHMFPLGMLFGLGFDTATEVGLLGLAASQATRGLPLWSIMVFPLLFTAGMTLVDSIDNTLMLGAYHWAGVHPVRKLYYNLTITLVSVLVAVLVGGIEVLNLFGAPLNPQGRFWRGLALLNQHFAILGLIIIGLFAACWISAVLLARVKRVKVCSS